MCQRDHDFWCRNCFEKGLKQYLLCILLLKAPLDGAASAPASVVSTFVTFIPLAKSDAQIESESVNFAFKKPN